MENRKVLVNFFVTSRAEASIEVPADLTDEQVRRALLLGTHNAAQWRHTAVNQMISAADQIEGTIDWEDTEGFQVGDLDEGVN